MREGQDLRVLSLELAVDVGSIATKVKAAARHHNHLQRVALGAVVRGSALKVTN